MEMSSNRQYLKWIILFLTGSVLLFFAGKYLLNEIQLYSSFLYRELKINKNKCVILDEKDTHGGFHGDGTYYVILDCAENSRDV